MRYLFAFLVLVPSLAFAQQNSPTLKEYEDVLQHFSKRVDATLKFDSWKDSKFVHKETKKQLLFKDLTSLEKHTFVLLTGDKLTKEMGSMDKMWQEELAKFADPKHVPVPLPKIENEKQKPALKENVEGYVKDLTKLRKKFAKEFEAYAEKMAKDFEKDLTKAERDYLIKEIKAYHTQNKLIEKK